MVHIDRPSAAVVRVSGWRGRFALAVGLGALLGGCVPALGPRPQPVAMADLPSTRSLATPPGSPAAWPQGRLWQGWGDPQLSALIEEALARSPDVAAAMARIGAARGVLEQAGASALPGVSGSGSVGGNKQSRNQGFPPQFIPSGFRGQAAANLAVDFDPDLWGRNRRELAAATSDARAAEVDAAQAALLLATSVAGTYGQLLQLWADGDALRATVTARTTALDLARQRLRAGLDNAAPAQQAEGALETARLDLSRQAEAEVAARHALAALLGAGPDRGLDIVRPAREPQVAQGLPADASIALIGRRPDIVAARLRVEAMSARNDAAARAFLPDISLSGLIGFSSLGIGKLFEANSRTASARAALSLPIFDGGLRAGTYRTSRAQYDEAVARYNSTVVGALRDLADTVAARDEQTRAAQAATAAETAAAAGQRLAEQRFRAGLSTRIDVMNATVQAAAARRVAQDTRLRRFVLDVALVRELGGGFAAAAPLSPEPSVP